MRSRDNYRKKFAWFFNFCFVHLDLQNQSRYQRLVLRRRLFQPSSSPFPCACACASDQTATFTDFPQISGLGSFYCISLFLQHAFSSFKLLVTPTLNQQPVAYAANLTLYTSVQSTGLLRCSLWDPKTRTKTGVVEGYRTEVENGEAGVQHTQALCPSFYRRTEDYLGSPCRSDFPGTFTASLELDGSAYNHGVLGQLIGHTPSIQNLKEKAGRRCHRRRDPLKPS